MNRSPRRAARRCAWPALVAVAVAVGGCGVPIDEEPRPIAQPTTTAVDQTPTTAASDGSSEVSVYFLRDGRLERVGFPVEGEPTLRQALSFVVAGLPEDADEGLRTRIPPDTTVLDVRVADGIATVDLSSQINDVTGPAQKAAFAQIVFTVLSFDAIEKVRFSVEGRPIAAPTDEGNLELITAGDYDPPLNPR